MYKIPDPESNPIGALVIFFKVFKGVEFDDRIWDDIHWARNMKRAKELLEIVGGFKNGKQCIENVGKRMDDSGLDWKLETIVKEAHEWKRKRGMSNDNNVRQRFLNALSQQRTNPIGEKERKLLTAGEALGSLGDFGITESESGYQITGGNIPDGGIGEEISRDTVEEPKDSGDGK